MPLVDPGFLKSVVWVYPDEASAQVGGAAGGTGFLVGVPLGELPLTRLASIYVVTCRHVIIDRERGKPYPNPAIVVRRRDRKVVPIVIPQDQWHFHDEHDDLAVGDWDNLSNVEHDFTVASSLDLIEESAPTTIGTEAFYMGRFQPTEDVTLTTARFGNLSTAEPVLVPNKELGIDQLSFLVESRTRTGYSGSPVAAFMKAPLIVNANAGPGPEPGTQTLSGNVILVDGPLKILGMVWGLWEETLTWTVRFPGGSDLKGEAVTDLNSGMVGVVPAWRIMQVLNLPELAAARRMAEEEWRQRPDHEAETGGTGGL